MRPKVLLIGHLYHPDGEAYLAERADLTVLQSPGPEDMLEAARTAQAISPRYPNVADAAVIDAAEDLVIIQTSGRGTDAVDIEAATRRGVIVCSNPGFGRIPVSEHALFLLLGLTRHGREHDAMVRSGRGWQDRLQDSNTIRDLQGGVLGIVGLGEIGSEMARKCSLAFNMKVLAYDPYVTAAHAESVGATLCGTLEEVLAQADHVSVHAELNDETRHMFDERALQQMQPHACLVNTARGKIVSQDALYRALTEGWIQAAALDVFEAEPVTANNPLLTLDNLFVSPHVGGLTARSMAEGAMSVATKILQALSGERPAAIINPEAWEPAKQRAMRLLSGG